MSEAKSRECGMAVRAGTSMRELHHMIQSVMPWQTYHLYDFNFQRGGAEVQIGDTQLWQEDMAPENDDRLFYVEDIFRAPGDQVIYTYDMGDDWQHEIKLHEIWDDLFKLPISPMLLGIEGFGPPEDCGGPHGYVELMKIARDPKHPESDASHLWLRQMGWNPSQYTLKKLQDALNKYKVPMWKQYKR